MNPAHAPIAIALVVYFVLCFLFVRNAVLHKTRKEVTQALIIVIAPVLLLTIISALLEWI